MALSRGKGLQRKTPLKQGSALKPGKPLARGKPLKAKTGLDSRSQLKRTPAKKSGKAYRRSDVSESDWRDSVLARDGHRCRSCGLRDVTGKRLSAHHVIFKSQCADQYVTDRRNGMTLCNEWGKGCHQAVHGGKLKISSAMMPREVRDCVAEQGLTYDDDGNPWGPCRKYFATERQ